LKKQYLHQKSIIGDFNLIKQITMLQYI